MISIKQTLDKIKQIKISFGVLLISILISSGLGLLLGKFAFSPRKTTEISQNTIVQNLNSDIAKLKGSLSMCQNDQATYSESEDKMYDYNDVSIYSPLFEGLYSKNTKYNYKGNEIEGFSYNLNKGEKLPIYVTIFMLKKALKLPQLEERLVKENNINTLPNGEFLHYDYYDFPIFYAYEFADFVRSESYISSWIPENPPNKDVYMSKNGIRMYKGMTSAPKCIDSVTLRFYATTEKGRQVFVIMSKAREYMFDDCYADKYESKLEINSLYGELENVADTIKLSKSD